MRLFLLHQTCLKPAVTNNKLDIANLEFDSERTDREENMPDRRWMHSLFLNMKLYIKRRQSMAHEIAAIKVNQKRVGHPQVLCLKGGDT